MSDNYYLDARHYGRLLRALRTIRGYDSASKVAGMINREGLEMSDRTYYAIERGEKVPGVDEHFAICAVLRPDPGYFEHAVKHHGALLAAEDQREYE